MEYHEPDARWSIFGANTFEDYLKRYVITGKFHSEVANDVIEGYKTAEYIMAYAYYHYPMYDEAFSKVLKLVEMAIKLKCNQLNITYTKQHKLNTLINKVSPHLPIIKISERLHAAREIRNHSMHPTQNSFTGGMLRGSIIALVNLLNEIFLPASFFIDSKRELERIKQLFIPFEKGTFVLEYNQNRFLIYKVKCFEVINSYNKWAYFVVCYPVINDVKSEIEDHKISGVLELSLLDVQIKDNTLTATSQNDGQLVTISNNNNPKIPKKLKISLKNYLNTALKLCGYTV